MRLHIKHRVNMMSNSVENCISTVCFVLFYYSLIDLFITFDLKTTKSIRGGLYKGYRSLVLS